jgi:hypothetical protein
MKASRFLDNAARALTTSAILACALVTPAHAYDNGASRGRTVSAQRCDSVRQAAWFERQRQLTDGDADPYKMATVAAECAGPRAATDARDGAAAYDSSLASASRSSVATSETAQYSMPARRQ